MPHINSLSYQKIHWQRLNIILLCISNIFQIPNLEIHTEINSIRLKMNNGNNYVKASTNKGAEKN